MTVNTRENSIIEKRFFLRIHQLDLLASLIIVILSLKEGVLQNTMLGEYQEQIRPNQHNPYIEEVVPNFQSKLSSFDMEHMTGLIRKR